MSHWKAISKIGWAGILSGDYQVLTYPMNVAILVSYPIPKLKIIKTKKPDGLYCNHLAFSPKHRSFYLSPKPLPLPPPEQILIYGIGRFSSGAHG